MSVKQSHYEKLLADYSNKESAIALLKLHRPYLEMLPSMRRSDESLISLPLPVVRVRSSGVQGGLPGVVPQQQTMCLPCDLALLMCDPEWKIKTGVEICVFIHRPDEDFSSLLCRWRETQVMLDNGYEWLFPMHYDHILGEGDGKIYPLFVVFEGTLERIKRGLRGSHLPFVVETLERPTAENVLESVSPESPSTQ